DALHVRFDASGDEPVQRTAGEPDWELLRIDFSGVSDPAAAAHAWMVSEWRAAPPELFTQALLTLAEDRFFWYHRYHFLLLDGRGMAMVTRRVAAVYTALAAGAPPGPRGFGTLAALVAD